MRRRLIYSSEQEFISAPVGPETRSTTLSEAVDGRGRDDERIPPSEQDADFFREGHDLAVAEWLYCSRAGNPARVVT